MPLLFVCCIHDLLEGCSNVVICQFAVHASAAAHYKKLCGHPGMQRLLQHVRSCTVIDQVSPKFSA